MMEKTFVAAVKAWSGRHLRGAMMEISGCQGRKEDAMPGSRRSTRPNGSGAMNSSRTMRTLRTHLGSPAQSRPGRAGRTPEVLGRCAHKTRCDPARGALARTADQLRRLQAPDPGPDRKSAFPRTTRCRPTPTPRSGRTSLHARRPFKTLQDYKNWVAQLHDVPRYFREQMDEMRAGMKRGFTPPRVTMEGRDSSITAVTDATPEASLFYTPFTDMPGVSAANQADLRARAVTTIRDVVQPVVRRIAEIHAHRVRPRLSHDAVGQKICRMARIFYRAKIREFTTLDMDPADIHSLGEAEVARLHGEMLAVMKETGFDGDFAAFLQFLRSDPRFYAKSADELLMRASWIAKKFDGKASLFFGYLPRAALRSGRCLMTSPRSYTSGSWWAGVYLLNTYNLPSRPLYNLTAAHVARIRAGACVPNADCEGARESARVSSAHLYLGLREGWALYLRASWGSR